MNYYPIFLDLRSRRCVIIGGGRVAARKARRLLDCGALVTVVCPHLDPKLEEMKDQGLLTHQAMDYQPSCLEGAFLVIGATDRPEINAKIAADARVRGILVNIVDDLKQGDFILPSLICRGDLTVAISTGGKSPALARKLREDLHLQFGPEYAVFLDIMGEIRARILARGQKDEENEPIFTCLVNSPLMEQIKVGDEIGAARTIFELTGLSLDLKPFFNRCGGV